MDTKNALYAAVGAPIAVAKTLNARFESLRTELESRTEDLAQTAQKTLDEWAKEGRQAVTKVSDGKMVDEFASKVDFDQAREQVNKLRDQLEDMLTTWRASFRPVEEAAAKATDKAADKVDEMTTDTATKPATKPAAKTTAAKKPAAKKPAAKKPASKPTTTRKPAAPKAS
jgi:ElaB/YqjD/DUF883 family membrane-anchored ribosome-binding protein